METLFMNDILQPKSIKEVYADHPNSRREEQCMSPHIAENIDRLSALTGYALEVTDMEKHEGPFRADIVCSDTESGAVVVIENMVGNTDTDHIGKIITYMAAEKTNCGIVICGNAREEHINAIKALNEHGYEIHLFELKFFELKFEKHDDIALWDLILKVEPESTERFITSPASTENKGRQIGKYADFFNELINGLKEDIPSCHFYARNNYQALFSGKWGAIWGNIGRSPKYNTIGFELGYDADKDRDDTNKTKFDAMVEELNRRYNGNFKIKHGAPQHRGEIVTKAVYTIDDCNDADAEQYKNICRNMYEVYCRLK